MIDWLPDWLTDWLTDWLIDFLTDWLTDWLHDWLIEWLIGWPIGWLIVWLIDSLIGWLIDFLTDWLIDYLNDLLNDWLTELLAYLVTCPWLNDRLITRPIDCPTYGWKWWIDWVLVNWFNLKTGHREVIQKLSSPKNDETHLFLNLLLGNWQDLWYSTEIAEKIWKKWTYLSQDRVCFL